MTRTRVEGSAFHDRPTDPGHLEVTEATDSLIRRMRHAADGLERATARLANQLYFLEVQREVRATVAARKVNS